MTLQLWTFITSCGSDSYRRIQRSGPELILSFVKKLVFGVADNPKVKPATLDGLPGGRFRLQKRPPELGSGGEETMGIRLDGSDPWAVFHSADDGALRSALAHEQQADPFKEFRRRIHSLRQEDVGLRVLSYTLIFPEKRIVGTVGATALMREMSSVPSMPGISTSLSTSSIFPFAKTVRASSAFVQQITR